MDFSRTLEWTRREMEAQRQQIGSYISDLRPRKRARRQEPEKRQFPPQTSRNMPRAQATPTQPAGQIKRASPVVNVQPTAAPVLYARDNPLVLDSSTLPPSLGAGEPEFTGATVPPSLQPVGGTAGHSATAGAPVVTVTQQPSSTPQPSGLSGTTEAIVIAASVAGAVILISFIVVCSICYRRRKRRSVQAHPLGEIPQRQKSTSSLHSEGWRSDLSEPEKQSLMRNSRSPSPSSRGQPTTASTHSQHRSLVGFRPFLPQIPESPIGPISSQPTSPTSIYTKGQSPPQPRDAGQLQIEQQLHQPPLSPLRPPPLRLNSRRGSEAPVGTAMLPSPKNPFSAVRMPFMSGAPSSHGRRRSSAQQSADGVDGPYDEESAFAGNRRTVESDTLPKAAGRYRDSFWSVAASSILGSSNNSTKVKSGYSEWNTVPSSLAWSHTRSTSSSSHSGLIPVGRDRSHSSVYSSYSTRQQPSEALVPALPPMPSAQQLQQQYGHHPNMSIASGGTSSSDNLQLKGRLHSVDFWAREEREMRLGTFEPAELEGSPTPDSLVPPPAMFSGTATPRDSTGEIIGAAVPGTPSKGFGMPPEEPQRGRETMSRGRLGADPYSNVAHLPSGPPSHGGVGGVQGGYTVTVSGGGSPPMPQGYTQESDDGRRLWSRARSSSRSRTRSASRGRGSSSTVATVFKQHPGDVVMF